MREEKGYPKGCSGAVLDVLTGIISKYGKKYCRVSQHRILELLKEMHGIVISRSTLNLWLKWLEKNWYIQRFKGHYKSASGKFVFRATSYYVLERALKWSFSFLNRVKKLLPLSRVRFFGQYQLINYNKMCSDIAANVEILLKSPIKGRASPI